jgi:hypothetical protein
MEDRRMKDVQKVFLAVWLPIMIIVAVALCGNVGKHYRLRRLDTDGIVRLKEGYIPPESAVNSILLLIFLSVCLYFVVGIEDKYDENTYQNYLKYRREKERRKENK